MGFVVDENVLRTANGEAPEAGLECQLAAIDFLLRCQRERSLTLDDAYRILGLYSEHCSHSGQPGVGDQFMVWARDTIGSLQRETLTPRDSSYEEFPNDPGLSTFDLDDHVWIATAQAGEPHHTVVNAVDSDYVQHKLEFERNNVTVLELCPEFVGRSANARHQKRVRASN